VPFGRKQELTIFELREFEENKIRAICAQEMMDEPYEWEKDWERVCGVLDFRVDSEVTLLKI
jgi:hypothetical protein